ncbi:MAG: hypothetical protein ACOY5B_15590 [Spirochaetota bacterium]
MTRFALVGGGPSLDYCVSLVEELAARDCKFLLSDSIAAGVLRRWPSLDVAIFTVELRRHPYLIRVPRPAPVYAYNKANSRNLRLSPGSKLTAFKLAGEQGDFPTLYSPGTVLGTMLAFAASNLAATGGEIHILGTDLFYIDDQVYSRFIDPHAPSTNRIVSREHWQYEMVLKKSSGILAKSGFAIRTSFEFMQARENMRNFIRQLPDTISLFEYSPLGLDCERVEKRIPGE